MALFYEGMSPGEVGVYLNAMKANEDRQLQQRTDAIRWQGAQDYDVLVKSGVPAAEAMRRTASRLFYNDPRGLAMATRGAEAPGQIVEQDGRQFIVNPGGKISAVPQRWTGSTTVMGPGNQIYKLPLTPEELQAAPRTSVGPSAPPVVQLPGGQGSLMLQPSGAATRIPPAQTDLVKVPDPENENVIRTLTKSEYMLERAQTRAKPLLDAYRANKAEMAAGEKKAVWDWIPGVETYEQKNARIEEQLKAYDLDVDGNPIKGSKLDIAINSGSQPAAPPPPVQVPVSPPGQMVSPAMIPARPRGRMVKPRQAPGSPAAEPAAPTTSGGGLGPNEVIKYRRMPNGQIVAAVFDRNTQKFIRYAQ